MLHTKCNAKGKGSKRIDLCVQDGFDNRKY